MYRLFERAAIAPLAQLDRVFDYESKGREFESRRARHKKSPVNHRFAGLFFLLPPAFARPFWSFRHFVNRRINLAFSLPSLGLPPCLPLALAAFGTSIVLSAMMSRSNRLKADMHRDTVILKNASFPWPVSIVPQENGKNLKKCLDDLLTGTENVVKYS